MDPETTQAAPQPVPVAQPSGETKKSGAANSTVSSFARNLAREEVQRQAQADAVEKVPVKTETSPTESAAQPAAEESQETPTDVLTETEATAETPEAETTEKTDEALSHENTLDPKLQEKINKRIGKEVAKRKQLEAEVAQLKAQVNTPPPVEEKITTVPVPANVPLADVMDATALAEVQRSAREMQRAAEELLDRDDIDQGVRVGDRTFSKSDLKKVIRDARLTLEDHVPARQQFLAAQEKAKVLATEQFPYLKDRSSAEYQEHRAALRANPWLMNQPNADWIVAVQLEGIKALAVKAEAAKKPAPKPAVTKPKPSGDSLVSADASATRVPVGSLNKQAGEAASKILSGKRGASPRDFAAYLRQQETIRNSR